MLRLAIYGRGAEEKDRDDLRLFFQHLEESETAYTVERNFAEALGLEKSLGKLTLFQEGKDLQDFGAHFILSLGGDGTLLDTLRYVREAKLPVLGINLGRLGFLSQAHRKDILEAVSALRNGHFSIEKRSVLDLQTSAAGFDGLPLALNDFTIHKRDTGSMITIDTYLNGEFFTSYWADGLIVSTPTGSTAYSLSCGGPVIFPDCSTFAITPVAPHNLNIRPIVVSDSTVISFRIRGRGSNHLLSLDSRFEVVEYGQEIAVQKANFFFPLLKLNSRNFIYTLREKLSWGLDTRNF